MLIINNKFSVNYLLVSFLIFLAFTSMLELLSLGLTTHILQIEEPTNNICAQKILHCT